MITRNLTLIALLFAGTAHAATFGISFSSSDIDETGSGGLFWNGASGTSPDFADITATDGTTSTGVSMETTNPGDFISENRGLNAPITENGITFPGSANQGYVADNLGSGRDGLMVFRFTAPNASQFEVWDFSIVASYDHNNPSSADHIIHYNVGGTYNAGTKSFSGGETLTLDAAPVGDNISAGTLSGILASFDGSNYFVDLQVGYGGSGSQSVGAITAMHVTTAPIPEPSTLVLLGIALGSVMIFRRRK